MCVFGLEIISIIVISFSDSEIMSSVDGVIRSIDVVSFHDGFKELRMVDSTFFHEIDDDVLGDGTHFLQIVALHTELIFQLAFFSEEFGVVSAIEVLLISSEGVELVGFDPRSEFITTQRLCLNLGYFTTSEKIEFADFILQRSPVPHSRNPSNVRQHKKHVHFVLGELKWL